MSGWLDELGFFHPATYGNHANVLRKVLKNQNVETVNVEIVNIVKVLPNKNK